MKVSFLNREEAQFFFKIYQTIYNWDPSDIEIKDYLSHETHTEGVDWLKPFNIFQADEIHINNTKLAEYIDASKYSLMDSEVLGIPSVLDNLAVVREDFEVGSPFNWLVLPMESGKMICSSFKECFIPF